MRRARATTKSLLGSDYQEEIVETPRFPDPLSDVSKYDEARLKEGLAFADQTLRNTHRRVSPITSHCLNLYKSTVKAVLTEEYDDETQREELLATVFLYEKDIYSKRFLRVPSDEAEAGLVDRLSQLRRYEFAARYGDYMSAVCDRLKTKARVERTQYFEQLQGWNRFWTDINSDINKETRAWERWLVRDPTLGDEEVKTRLAVYNACNDMALNFDQTLQAIAMYADRNSLVHASIQRYVERGEWNKLAESLSRDMRDLPVVIPSHLRPNIPIMQVIMQAVVDEYFVPDERQPTNHNLWIPRGSSHVEAAKRRAEMEDKKAAAIEDRKKIEAQAAKRCKELIHNHSMVHLTAAVLNLDPPTGATAPGSLKRPRDKADAEEKIKTHKRQKRAWAALVNLQKECHRRWIGYKNEFGQVEPPIDPEVWLDLAEEEDGVSARPSTSSARPSTSSARPSTSDARPSTLLEGSSTSAAGPHTLEEPAASVSAGDPGPSRSSSL